MIVEPLPRPPRRARARFGRVLRAVGLALAGAVVALAILLALPPGRAGLLRVALDLAANRLPGDFTWRRAAWPAPGRLELDGVLWVSPPDTLALADELRLQWRIMPLLRGEVIVDTLRVEGALVDLARLRAALRTATPDSTAAATPDRKLPAAALGSLVVRDLTLVIPAAGRVRIPALAGTLELRPDRVRGGEVSVCALLARGLGAAWRLRGRWDDGLALVFSPLPLSYGQPPPAPGSLPLDGALRISRAGIAELRGGGRWPRLELDNLRVTGVLGTATMHAHLAGRDSGRVNLAVDLARPPAELAGELADFAPDSLRENVAWILGAGWPATDPHLELAATLIPPPSGSTARAMRVGGHASFSLPGPADLAFLLPEAVRVDDLGALAGHLTGRYDGLASPPSYEVDLDLSPTAWLRAGRLRARGQGRTVVVDELALDMAGLSVTAAGRVDTTAAELSAMVDLPDLSLLRRWPHLVPDQADGHARLRLALNGSLPYPDGELQLTAGARTERWAVPFATLTARLVQRRLDLRFAAPRGLKAAAATLDSISLAASVDLAGAPDSLRARLHARAARDTSAVMLAGDIGVARRPTGLPAVWVRLDTLWARHGAEALSLAAPCALSLDPADSSLTLSGLQVDGRFGQARADAWVRRDSLDIDLDLDLAVALDELRPLLPAATAAALPQGTAALTGKVHLLGTPARPVGSASLAAQLRDVPGRPPVGLQGTVWLLAEGGPAPPIIAGGQTPPSDAPATGLAADLGLTVDGGRLLDFSARLPARISTRPPRFELLESPASASLSGTKVDLARLAALLPTRTRLSGSVDVDLRAAGVAPDLGLAGGLAVSDLRLELADGSWVTAGGRVTAAGTTRAADLQGAITITSGLLHIPDLAPQLLPVAGPALLWSHAAIAPAAAVGDLSSAPIPVPADPPAPASAPTASLRLTSPGNLWLRGRGLDLELRGDLAIQLRGKKTTLTGDLTAVRGSLSLLGRNFSLEHGSVSLDGDLPQLQPQLDVSLTTKLGSTQYWVRLTGSPLQMNLQLSSAPEMTEGDIMATLIFGKPLERLDAGQTDLVAQRSAEIAAAFGAGKLQNLVAAQLGLDLVRIAPDTENASATSLTIGKYLSPKVMVSYEQTLASVSTFVVHLEYLIRGGLRVHSAVSQGESSGIELLWSHDY